MKEKPIKQITTGVQLQISRILEDYIPDLCIPSCPSRYASDGLGYKSVCTCGGDATRTELADIAALHLTEVFDIKISKPVPMFSNSSQN